MSLHAQVLFPSVSLDKRKVAAKLDGKTVLITGATFGIGEALVKELFYYNVHLILVARTTEKLLALQGESRLLNAKVTPFTCDFYDEESVSDLCVKLRSVHIDFFVSNAGKSIMRSLSESVNRYHDYRRTIAVNYLAPVHIITGLAGSFSASNTHIVNVSTYNVLMKTPPNWSAYVSSKKAMHSWMESNTIELARMNITVSNVYFPLIESRMKEANMRYERTPAMAMETAVAILVNSLLRRNYHYKPWWHVPFQALLFIAYPFWKLLWTSRLGKKLTGYGDAGSV